MYRIKTYLHIMAALLLGTATASAQANLLTNGNFQDRRVIQTLQTHGCNDLASAVDWRTWIATSVGCVPDSGVELETDLLFASAPGLLTQPLHIMHIRAETLNPHGFGTPNGTGLVQVFDPAGKHSRVLASVLVYVVKGQVGIGVGFDGSVSLNAHSSTLGQWERITTLNVSTPATELVLYGSDPNGSEFYAQNAAVCAADTDFELAACELQLGKPTGK